MRKGLKSLAIIAIAGIMVFGTVFSSYSFKRIKGSTNGDYPGAATFTQAYTSSTVSGNTVSNAWSGFTMTLPGVPTVSIDEDGTDWYYEVAGTGSIICSYFPITRYGSGDIATFINGLCGLSATYKGEFKGGAFVSTTPVTLGSLQFYQLSRADASPAGSFNDYCYVREVPGTGYVQVLIIDNSGTGETLNSTVGTIA